MTAIDVDWQKLIDKYDIINRIHDDGMFPITSKQIKEVHEPRLMAKFDCSAQLPRPVRENHISILPVSNVG